MNRLKLAVSVVACLSALYATGCTAEEHVVVHEPRPVQVNTAPPPEQVEVVPVAPSVEHIWIKGHWHWNGVQWVWRPGRYEVRRVGYRWVPAHYENRGGTWIYLEGHYAR